MSIADRADVSIARDYAALIGGSQGAPGNQLQGAESIRLCARSAELLPEVLAALRAFVADAGLRDIDRDDPRFEAASAAIANAEGCS